MKVEARVTSIQVNPKEKTSWNAELVTLSLSRPSRKHKWQLALLPETLKKAKVLDLIHPNSCYKRIDSSNFLFIS